MACPTCDHTMARVNPGDYNDPAIYHCPRCGTMKCMHDLGETCIVTPKLVKRCQDLEVYLEPRSDVYRRWMAMGLNESIHLPKDRDHE